MSYVWQQQQVGGLAWQIRWGLCVITAGEEARGNEEKLEGVGPVNNRPSTNYLHHFVKKEEEKSDT